MEMLGIMQLHLSLGNFRQGIEVGTILKKMCLLEKNALEKLNEDPFLKGFVPEYSGMHSINGEGNVCLTAE